MTKCGRGLAKEFALAVRNGEISEVFNIADLVKFIDSRGWNPSKSYVTVLLANSSSTKHSKTYVKYFMSCGNGQYKLVDDIEILLQKLL